MGNTKPSRALTSIISTLAIFALLTSNRRLSGQEVAASDNYPLTADSLQRENVPRGEVFRFDLTQSAVFPNTHRTISVYVPAQYKSGMPACVYVGLDALGFNASTVFDNLIARRDMPMTIAIGVAPGNVESAEGGVDPRSDRSFEFDNRNDRLARFITEEVFPEVERHTTADGRKIVLSRDGNDHMIGGSSTGGIGAFTVAWEHPEEFRRVFTAIGTFVGMRGGEGYYVEVRKTEPKPIRVFLQDGSHDEWPGGPEMGDWWMSNQTMERALSFSGYDVKHAWGIGTHNGNQAAAVFPDAVRWLWHGWPAPVVAGQSENPVLKAILEDNSGWEVAGTMCPGEVAISSGPDGKIYRWLSASRRLQQLPDHASASACASGTSAQYVPIAAGPDGKFYVADRGRNEILEMSPEQQNPRVVASVESVKTLIVRENGDLYVTTESVAHQTQLWLIRKNGGRTLLADGLKEAEGLAFSPDRKWLFVSQAGSRMSFSYRVKGDGSIDSGEPFYDLYVPAWADASGAGSVWVDTSGLAYVATSAGVQVIDRGGRVAALLPLPGNKPVTSLCFGGADFHTLYITSGGRLFARRLRAAGAPAWRAAIQLTPGIPG